MLLANVAKSLIKPLKGLLIRMAAIQAAHVAMKMETRIHRNSVERVGWVAAEVEEVGQIIINKHRIVTMLINKNCYINKLFPLRMITWSKRVLEKVEIMEKGLSRVLLHLVGNLRQIAHHRIKALVEEHSRQPKIT